MSRPRHVSEGETFRLIVRYRVRRMSSALRGRFLISSVTTRVIVGDCHEWMSRFAHRSLSVRRVRTLPGLMMRDQRPSCALFNQICGALTVNVDGR